jgi:hypothetical protein
MPMFIMCQRLQQESIQVAFGERHTLMWPMQKLPLTIANSLHVLHVVTYTATRHTHACVQAKQA